MPYVSLPFNIEWSKTASIIFGKLYTKYRHIPWMSINRVSEYFLILFWVLIISSSKRLGIQWYWMCGKAMPTWFTSIYVKIFYRIFISIKRKLLNFLHVYKMKMNWMSVRCKIYDIEIISFTNFVSTICTVHTIHHRNTIYKHRINVIILAGNLK